MAQLLSQMTGDLPPEWVAIPPEILQLLVPVNVRTLHTAKGEEKIVSARGIITPQQKRTIDAVLASRWFLVKNGGALPRARCMRCKRYHQYITLACIEKPHNGLGEVVGLIERVTEIGTRRQKIGHRQYRDVVMTETQIDAVELGPIVPITPSEARGFIDRINAKGYGWQGAIPDPHAGLLVPA